MPDHLTPAPDEDPWLTVPQVSQELKLHPATVRVWINSGRLGAVRAGRTWRVRRSEVDRALLSDASPAYVRQEASPLGSTGRPELDSSRPEAPRKLADHIMTVRPQGAEQS
ncbi:MAG: helix-turn-helix domain-containing protein [Trebonia sp.]